MLYTSIIHRVILQHSLDYLRRTSIHVCLFFINIPKQFLTVFFRHSNSIARCIRQGVYTIHSCQTKSQESCLSIFDRCKTISGWKTGSVKAFSGLPKEVSINLANETKNVY